MNMKKMSQEEFDKYMILELIPEIEEDFGKITHIVLTKKGKFKFANECEECHELVMFNKEFDISREILNTIGDDASTYLETLTELDVVYYDDIIECECFEDEIISDDEIDDTEDFYENPYIDESIDEDDLYFDEDEGY